MAYLKKHYKDYQELKSTLENIVKKQVKHYKSDWTDYDAPRLDQYNASREADVKKLIWIARDCGTWLLIADDIKNPESCAYTIYNYYLPGGPDNPKRNPNKYFKIDLLALTIEILNLDEKGRIIKRTRKAKKAA